MMLLFTISFSSSQSGILDISCISVRDFREHLHHYAEERSAACWQRLQGRGGIVAPTAGDLDLFSWYLLRVFGLLFISGSLRMFRFSLIAL